MKIASPFGIPLYLHWSWFFLVAIVGIVNGLASLLILLGMFFFVLLHEYGHCFAARYYGLEVTDVTFYPIGGVARIPSLGNESPWHREFIIAIAGPLVNLVICVLAILVSLIGLTSYIEVVVNYTFTLNAILFAFNLLIPVFPMDGGRVLRASLYGIMQDYERSTEIAVRFGQIFACGIIFLAFMSGHILICIIFLLVCLGAQRELAEVKRQAALERLKEYLAKTLDNPELKNATLPQ